MIQLFFRNSFTCVVEVVRESANVIWVKMGEEGGGVGRVEWWSHNTENDQRVCAVIMREGLHDKVNIFDLWLRRGRGTDGSET